MNRCVTGFDHADLGQLQNEASYKFIHDCCAFYSNFPISVFVVATSPYIIMVVRIVFALLRCVLLRVLLFQLRVTVSVCCQFCGIRVQTLSCFFDATFELLPTHHMHAVVK